MIYNKGQILMCPHCGKEPDGVSYKAEDFIVPGRHWSNSKKTQDCGWCDALFTVQLLENGKYLVKTGI